VTATTGNETTWRDAIRELAAFQRPSASEGERRAAEWIAERLRDLGCGATVERERAHGGYWWPIGSANLLALAGGLVARRGRLRRMAGAAIAATAASALWDDLGHGRRWFRRAALPHKDTWNVVAETGDTGAARTVVLVAHHDAAHSGLVFHPGFGQIGPRFTPRAHERANHTLPILYAVWLGPVAIALGALTGLPRLRKAGSVLALGATAAMADIGIREVVPGANDNLSAVGALLALAAAFQKRPVEGVRVLLVSTGSEESFSEGMQAFGERHFSDLDPAQTEFLCLECLGGETLIVLEGEGMLRMRDYTSRTREALADAAARAGVQIQRGIQTVAATDAIIALRAGYPTVTLAAIEATKLPLNYHWPNDTPENLHWETIEDAIAVSEEFVRGAPTRRP
jgi:acetylornithine deacetylase/succinyl-diaminopimelate desuccinylase-like protein